MSDDVGTVATSVGSLATDLGSSVIAANPGIFANANVNAVGGGAAAAIVILNNLVLAPDVGLGATNALAAAAVSSSDDNSAIIGTTPLPSPYTTITEAIAGIDTELTNLEVGGGGGNVSYIGEQVYIPAGYTTITEALA